MFSLKDISSDCVARLFSDMVLLVVPSLTLTILPATNLHAAWRFIHGTPFLTVQESDKTLQLSCKFQELLVCPDYIIKMMVVVSLNKCTKSKSILRALIIIKWIRTLTNLNGSDVTHILIYQAGCNSYPSRPPTFTHSLTQLGLYWACNWHTIPTSTQYYSGVFGIDTYLTQHPA